MKTKIEWCDYTINCFWGCDKGCSYCAARSIAKRFGKRIGTARGYDAEKVRRMSEFKPVFLADQICQIAKIKKPSRIFMSFMGEPFAPEFEGDLPIAFQTARAFPQHSFLMLTKRPENLAKFSPFPPNVWVGVSATVPYQMRDAFKNLEPVKATVKFVSFEPLLGGIIPFHPLWIPQSGVNWLIIGQQTPPSKKAEPRIEWIQEIVEAADKAGVPVFLKNNLIPLLENASCPKSESLFIGENGIRQELPSEGSK